jgi:hypothetical protein
MLVYCFAGWLLVHPFALAQGTPGTPAPPADAAEVQQEIRQVEVLLPKLPDRGAALFLLAHDYAHLGNFEKALSVLDECVSLNEGFDPEGDPAFDPLKSKPELQQLIERVHRHYPAVHQAHAAFEVREKELIPEGLAADPKTGVLYMGSLHLRKIVKITRNGEVSDFIKAGQYDIRPICGLKVDTADESLWANTCANNGLGAELLHFDRTGKIAERFPPPTPGQHLFNDLVLRNEHEIYLTDSLATVFTGSIVNHTSSQSFRLPARCTIPTASPFPATAICSMWPTPSGFCNLIYGTMPAMR